MRGSGLGGVCGVDGSGFINWLDRGVEQGLGNAPSLLVFGVSQVRIRIGVLCRGHCLVGWLSGWLAHLWLLDLAAQFARTLRACFACWLFQWEDVEMKDDRVASRCCIDW